ncbi:hypothetical protein HK097_000866 [Rhizophlyctis rosea]|uniref:Uncharacterized protein n=1 Tax=Rhizophlyctis rosea TaxID=64517 RepID=A0AAD5SH78_9FUNG|nr:hypothetical protein HK097_000866 [Rhizophlyctis rosea]
MIPLPDADMYDIRIVGNICLFSSRDTEAALYGILPNSHNDIITCNGPALDNGDFMDVPNIITGTTHTLLKRIQLSTAFFVAANETMLVYQTYVDPPYQPDEPCGGRDGGGGGEDVCIWG